jgi:hypothetical protein
MLRGLTWGEGVSGPGKRQACGWAESRPFKMRLLSSAGATGFAFLHTCWTQCQRQAEITNRLSTLHMLTVWQ